MRRREFLSIAASTAVAGVTRSVLVHEHVLVDFVGADAIRPGRYRRDEVFRAALPRLKEVRALGCQRLLECTPNFLGRDPDLLGRLADAAGLEIWSNTGLYGAANHKYLPAFARQQTAEQLARQWVAEAREPWRPRFIKIGVNRSPLDELDRKLVRSAAITSRETGLTIASHTGDGAAALEQLEIVTAAGVAPAKFVWVHAQNERDHKLHQEVARAGAWGRVRRHRGEHDRVSSGVRPVHGCEQPVASDTDIAGLRLVSRGRTRRRRVSRIHVSLQRFPAAARTGSGSDFDVGQPAHRFWALATSHRTGRKPMKAGFPLLTAPLPRAPFWPISACDDNTAKCRSRIHGSANRILWAGHGNTAK